MSRILPALMLVFGTINMAAAQPADGSYEVRLPHTAGKKCSEDALFRFNIAQGQLSGSFVGPRGRQPLSQLVFEPGWQFQRGNSRWSWGRWRS